MIKVDNLNKIYVARQPIFDRFMNIYGYELLFRNSKHNYFLYDESPNESELSQLDKATLELINNSYTIFGIKNLVHSKKAFINYTENLLNDEFYPNFPNKNIVFEIPNTITLTKQNLINLKKFKKDFELTICNLNFNKNFSYILKLVDYIKLDISQYKIETLKKIIKTLKKHNLTIICEKIETQKQFELLKSLQVDYFQGFFFEEPEIIESDNLTPFKTNYLKILQEINKSEIDINNLVNIIKKDVSLTYKLLQYINSAFFGLNTKITSIKDALNLLGIKQVRKWVTIIGLSLIGEDKPSELLKNALIRAKFGELLAKSLSMEDKSNELFLMGMFSLLDVFFNRPINQITNELPIDQDIKNALNGEENIYQIILQLIKDYEHGKWENILHLSKKLQIMNEPIPQFFFESIKWAQSAIEERV